MPFGLQPIHLIVIAIVALVIFGPSRLPELGRSVGKMITEFRRGAQEMTEGLKDELANPSDEGSSAALGAQTPSPATIIQSPPPPTASALPNDGSQASTGLAQPGVVTSEAPATRYCIACGASNLPEARYCNKCGASLPA